MVVLLVETGEILVTQGCFDVGDNTRICAKGLEQADYSVCLRLCNGTVARYRRAALIELCAGQGTYNACLGDAVLGLVLLKSRLCKSSKVARRSGNLEEALVNERLLERCYVSTS